LLEHFSCCWVFGEGLAVAFLLGKTPMNIKPLRYTHRGNALATASFIEVLFLREKQRPDHCFGVPIGKQL
jgi:hypothetical protein